MGVNVRVCAKKVLHTWLLARLLKMERSDDTGLVAETVQGECIDSLGKATILLTLNANN